MLVILGFFLLPGVASIPIPKLLLPDSSFELSLFGFRFHVVRPAAVTCPAEDEARSSR